MNRTVTLEYPGCFVEGIIMHELLHTLGIYNQLNSY
jgi:predicted SprT family Zn-dependent metalloprotease